MPFKKGNKFSQGGIKGNKGGRPSKAELQALITVAELARKRLEKSAGKIMNRYIELATRDDPATTRHAVDKILPDDQMESTQQPPHFAFINFADIRRPSQILPPAPLIPYLDAKENAEQGQLEKLKPPQVKFHAFSSRKRKAAVGS